MQSQGYKASGLNLRDRIRDDFAVRCTFSITNPAHKTEGHHVQPEWNWARRTPGFCDLTPHGYMWTVWVIVGTRTNGWFRSVRGLLGLLGLGFGALRLAGLICISQRRFGL